MPTEKTEILDPNDFQKVIVAGESTILSDEDEVGTTTDNSIRINSSHISSKQASGGAIVGASIGALPASPQDSDGDVEFEEFPSISPSKHSYTDESIIPLPAAGGGSIPSPAMSSAGLTRRRSESLLFESFDEFEAFPQSGITAYDPASGAPNGRPVSQNDADIDEALQMLSVPRNVVMDIDDGADIEIVVEEYIGRPVDAAAHTPIASETMSAPSFNNEEQVTVTPRQRLPNLNISSSSAGMSRTPIDRTLRRKMSILGQDDKSRIPTGFSCLVFDDVMYKSTDTRNCLQRSLNMVASPSRWLLRGVGGYLEAGRVAVLLEASAGSGHKILLRILGQRFLEGKSYGQLRWNCKEYNRGVFDTSGVYISSADFDGSLQLVVLLPLFWSPLKFCALVLHALQPCHRIALHAKCSGCMQSSCLATGLLRKPWRSMCSELWKLWISSTRPTSQWR